MSHTKIMAQVVPAVDLHEVLSQAHSDLYKDLNGIRPRWMRYGAMSVDTLGSLVLELQEEAEELVHEWDGIEARIEADLETDRQAALVEAKRAHEERWLDAAAAQGAAGW